MHCYITRCNQLFKILLDSSAARIPTAIAMADKYLRPTGFDEVKIFMNDKKHRNHLVNNNFFIHVIFKKLLD